MKNINCLALVWDHQDLGLVFEFLTERNIYLMMKFNLVDGFFLDLAENAYVYIKMLLIAYAYQ